MPLVGLSLSNAHLYSGHTSIFLGVQGCTDHIELGADAGGALPSHD